MNMPHNLSTLICLALLGSETAFPQDASPAATTQVATEKAEPTTAAMKPIESKGTLAFAVREAKSGKPWSAKKVSWRIEPIAGGAPREGKVLAAGPTQPEEFNRGLYLLHVMIGERSVPPAKILVAGGGAAKIEFLVGGGGRVDIRQTYEFGQIAFESNKALLLEESRPRLERLYELMKAHPVIKKMSLEGYTDSSGNPQTNIAISAERAKTIYGYLYEKGIESDRLKHQGYGSERPLVDNATPAGRAINRRVEFVVTELGEKDEDQEVKNESTAASVAEVIKETAKQLVETVSHPWIFIGVDVGGARIDTSEPKELDKNGRYVAAKTMINFYFPSLVLEGGGGIFNASFPSKSNGDIIGESAQIQTAYILGAARYPFGYGLELGLAGQIMFGAANDFGPVEKGKHENYFMGPELVYQPQSFKNYRLAFDILQDYTINNRNVTIFTFGLQAGLEVNERESYFSTKESKTPIVPQAPSVPLADVEAKPVPQAAPVTKVGSVSFRSREATSGKPWTGKVIAYSLTRDGAVPVEGNFSDGGPTPETALTPGHWNLSLSVGDKKAATEIIVHSDSNIKIEVLAATGRIELRQLIEVGEIKFESNNDIILPESERNLKALASFLTSSSEISRLAIEGFTDSSGNAVKNLDLSQRRAESVKKFLQAEGIAADRLVANGYGSARPLVDNATPEGRSLNRRVEFVVLELKKREQAAGAIELKQQVK